MRNSLRLAPLLAVLVLSACGGHSRSATSPAPKLVAPVSHVCPPGRSQMGCSEYANPKAFTAPQGIAPTLTLSHAGLFPDVSMWQGAVGWSSVAAWQRRNGWTPAGIFKIGEYSFDSQAARSASQTLALHMWRAGYWFLRNTGCSHETALILSAAALYHLTIIVLDSEVPEAAGYVGCIAPTLRAHHLLVVTYTAPGTWPGGSGGGTSGWIATYGSSHARCLPFTCTILAWQCTDGRFGCVTDVPGIGRDDVSVDLGITKLGAAPAPPPVAGRAWLTGPELAVVRRYDGARQHRKYDAYRIRVLQPDLTRLAHVIWIAHPGHSWAYRHRGLRFQELYRRSLGQKIA